MLQNTRTTSSETFGLIMSSSTRMAKSSSPVSFHGLQKKPTTPKPLTVPPHTFLLKIVSYSKWVLPIINQIINLSFFPSDLPSFLPPFSKTILMFITSKNNILTNFKPQKESTLLNAWPFTQNFSGQLFQAFAPLMFIGESNFMTCGSGSQDTKGES
jgi:hypothetical protein